VQQLILAAAPSKNIALLGLGVGSLGERLLKLSIASVFTISLAVLRQQCGLVLAVQPAWVAAGGVWMPVQQQLHAGRLHHVLFVLSSRQPLLYHDTNQPMRCAVLCRQHELPHHQQHEINQLTGKQSPVASYFISARCLGHQPVLLRLGRSICWPRHSYCTRGCAFGCWLQRAAS
jgi:hypothetical protein